MVHRWVIGFLSITVLSGSAAALAASPDGDRCGHVQELQRARAALAEGDRATALVHLRRADTLLKSCQERLPEPQPRVGDRSDAAVG
jgi:hypothetical protein